MSDGQETRVGYPLIASVCALVLVGGPILAMVILSAKQQSKAPRHAVASTRQPDPVPPRSRLVENEDLPASQSETADEATDAEEPRVKEAAPKFEETEKNKEHKPKEENPVEPKSFQPPPNTGEEKLAEEKPSDGSPSVAPPPLSPEEKMVQIIRAFIVRQLAHPDGFAVVDHTKPQRVRAANNKPAKVMRVVFRAEDGFGRSLAYDFLFVVQKDEVVEHAPTAAYVAAERARQQAMLRVVLLNQAILQQELQAAAGASGGGGGPCIIGGG